MFSARELVFFNFSIFKREVENCVMIFLDETAVKKRNVWMILTTKRIVALQCGVSENL
jgi:hypothetical protein